jgi:hypothetical protein
MIKFEITLDSDLLQRMAAMGIKDSWPAAKAAFDASAKTIQGAWRGWALGGSLMGIPHISNPSTNLARSIKIRKNANFDVNIETDSAHAQRIRDGTPELDMKTTHPYGKKSRVSKKTDEKHPGGIPYLIVPFRWGTPDGGDGARAHWKNVIPQSMYSAIQAFNMVKSIRLEKREDGTKAIHAEKNFRGAPIERSEYDWGERIRADGNIDGLVRMADQTQKSGSTYFTFRIISAASPKESWIRKAVDSIDVESALEKATRPAVEEMIQAGFEADIGI